MGVNRALSQLEQAEERVQVSQNLSLPSNDELEHFRKTDLQAYLKARGVGLLDRERVVRDLLPWVRL